jgi:hypothetical protein
MLVMQVTKHPADLCPAYHDKFRAITVGWYENIESIAAKFGVRFLGSWDDHASHTVFVLYETPSMDSLMAMMMDPVASGPLAFCTSRVFPVFDHKTTLNMIKR